MNMSHPTTLEEVIIEKLAGNTASGKQLLAAARNLKVTLTKQALYVVLRRLLATEVVVKHGTTYSLSNVWLDQMAVFFAKAQERYGSQQKGADFLMLGNGDKISYSFKNLNETDGFWGHAFDVLADVMPADEPIFIYNPHEWFLYARQKNETHLFNKLKGDKRQLWLTIGSRDPLDVYAKQFFDGQYLQYHMNDKTLFEKRNYYLNIFGDYIIEATTDPETALHIDEFYKNTTVYDENVIPALQKIVSRGKTKLTISRNNRKAKKLKGLFAQFFYIAK